MFTLTVSEPEFLEELVAQLELDTITRLELVLQQVGIETIAYLRSLTSVMRPPVGSRLQSTKRRRYLGGTPEQGPLAPGGRRRRIGAVAEAGPLEAIPARMSLGQGQPRPAHPGGWADVSSQLVNSYAWRVEKESDSVALILENSAEYAVHLEAREGYFVLGGVLEPGGPVEHALRTVAAAIAPDWTIVSGGETEA